MSEVIKIERLEDGAWLEFYSDGRIRAKSREGKLMSHPANYTPAEAAQALGKKAAQKAIDTSGEIGDLLEYLGLDSPFHFQLAKLLVDGKAGAVAAAKELVAESKKRGSFKAEHKQFDILPGRLYYATTADELREVRLNQMGIDKVADFIDFVREEHPELTGKSNRLLE